MGAVEGRIRQLGHTLPGEATPGGNYVPSVLVPAAGLVYLAGHVARRPDGSLVAGKLGADLTVEQGADAARITMLNLLGSLKARIGELDRVTRVVKLLCMVNCTPEFGQQPWIASALEVMLGYSDTSKRMGVLSSRLAIHDAMQDIGRWARRRDLRIIFFHGSGGSVGRGGGTVEEQFATWPPGAGHVVKQTLQGVNRRLASLRLMAFLLFFRYRQPSRWYFLPDVVM